jgi:DNA-binding beta-propeller fold protein YncE
MKYFAAAWIGALLGAGSSVGCDGGLLPIPELVYGLDSHWPRSSTYEGVGAGRIVVTNSIDDTISLFDLARVGQPDFRELVRLPVGLSPVELEGPHHAAIDPSGVYYYVNISNYVPGAGGGPHGPWGIGRTNGYVLKYRSSDNALIAHREVDRSPGDLVISRDGKELYISHYDILRILEVVMYGGADSEMDTRLMILDTQTLAVKHAITLCPAAHGVKLSPDGSRAYVSCISDEIAVVDLAAPTAPAHRVRMAEDAGPAIAPKYEPYALTLAPSGDVWVSCRERNELRVVDAQTLAVDPGRIVVLTGAPMFGAFSPDGARLYMPTQINDVIAVIDPATGALLREIPVRSETCLNVHQFRFTPDGRWGLVVCEGDHGSVPGALVVLDMANGEAFVQAVPVGRFPDFVDIMPGAP